MKRIAKLLGLLFLALVVLGLALAWRGFGKSVTTERMRGSPQWKDGHFENPQPLWNDWVGFITRLAHVSEHTTPSGAVPTAVVDPAKLATPPESGLRVTWFGHSSTLIEVDGVRLLTDPVWSERVTPVQGFGPKRYHGPLISLSDLPRIDAVLISHDHYDHLDEPTVMQLKDHKFIVPLGVGAHLAYWGVPQANITETDWWEITPVGGIDVVTTPARHASGRTVWDRDATLWAGYAVRGKTHRVYYSGDTGLFPAMKDIGERFGPFDLTMIEVGQYDQTWPDWHIGPEQAITAHKWLQGRTLLPIHWALFTLAYHGWTEPIERALAAAGDAQLVTPLPGEAINGTPGVKRWWPNVPWETADKNPVKSTKL